MVGARLLVVAGLLAACSPARTSETTMASPAGTAITGGGAGLDVRFGGAIGCATFPYACRAVLSVLDAGTDVDAEWRPPASDPWWGPDWSTGTTTDHLEPTAIGALPDLAPGRHRLVVSLLGSYDVPSYAPDGTVAMDLLARCAMEVDVSPTTSVVSVVVMFTPDPETFGGTCAITRVP